MRTRTRNTARRTLVINAHNITCVNNYCDGTSETFTGSLPSITQVSSGRDELIIDDLGKKSVHGVKHRIHDFDVPDTLPNAMFGIDSPKLGVQTQQDPQSWVAGNVQYVRGLHMWNILLDATPPNWSVGTVVDEVSIVSNLWKRAQQLKADVLLNLIEANQALPAVKSLATSLPHMAANWRNLRKVIRTASNSFLAWKFGVSPIISDMMKVQKYLPSMGSDIQRHIDGDKQRFSTSVGVTATLNSPTYLTADLNGYPRYRFIRQGRYLTSPIVRYVLVIKPKAAYSTSFFQKLDAFASRFATSPAQLLWEKIPFSFVVDWFVDVSGLLRAADKVVGFAPYEMIGFTKSLKYGLATDTFIDCYSPCSGAKITAIGTGSFEYYNYERSLVGGGPMVSWQPRFGKSQAGISAALIAQQLSRVR